MLNIIITGLLFFTGILSLLVFYYYVTNRLSNLLNFNDKKIIFITATCAATLLILSNILIIINFNVITRLLYIFANTIAGLFFIAFFILIIHHLLSVFLRQQKQYLQYITGSIIIILWVTAVIQGMVITIKEIEISTDVDYEIRIIHITDMHLGAVHGENRIKNIVEKSNGLNPDIILITGDLFDGSARPSKQSIGYLNKFDAPVYFSMGNHEFYEGETRVIQALKDIDMITLRNEKIIEGDLELIGADDLSFGKSLETILSPIEINEEKMSILLYHRPKDLNVASDYGVDLVLSGHTHRGQIFPFTIAAYFGNEGFLSGLYTVNNTSIYISQGTGTWGPPLRLGTQNTITLLRLVPQN